MRDMYSTQEEGDTRMLLYAVNTIFVNETGKMVERVIIKSPDTDVLVLAVHYFPRIQHLKELWIEKGATTSVRNTHRFVPVHDICKIMIDTFSQILPAVHTH